VCLLDLPLQIKGIGELLIQQGDHVLPTVGGRSGQSWPATFRRADAVSIIFTAGYGAAAGVPEPIRQAILLIVQRLFDGADTSIDVAIDRTVHALIAPYRRSPI